MEDNNNKEENNSRSFSRWYDKDSRLSDFLGSLQELDEYSLYLVAKEFLQIIVNKHVGENDSSINSMNAKAVAKYNRWYDWNYDLHTCVEYLKDLDQDARHDLIQAFKEVCIQHLTNYYPEAEVNIKEDDEDE